MGSLLACAEFFWKAYATRNSKFRQQARNALSGVGEVKRERYGEAFLEVIAEHAQQDE